MGFLLRALEPSGDGRDERWRNFPVCANIGGLMDINLLEQILSLLKRNEVSDFELQHEGTWLKLSRAQLTVQAATAPHGLTLEPAIVGQGAESLGTAGGRGGAVADHLTKVESPIVGTFYRRPSPDSEPFVKEGDRIKKGDTLCIIEAMKLMNEIESPASGRIEKILLNDGQVVEYGEVLFLLNPDV